MLDQTEPPVGAQVFSLPTAGARRGCGSRQCGLFPHSRLLRCVTSEYAPQILLNRNSIPSDVCVGGYLWEREGRAKEKAVAPVERIKATLVKNTSKTSGRSLV